MTNSDPFQNRPARSLSSLSKFQFGLAQLLIAIAVFAVLLLLAVRAGSFLGIVLYSFIICVVPTVLVTCVIYGRGEVRAFAIGATVPCAAAIVFRIPWAPDGFWLGFWEIIWLVVMGIICGALAVATRWWVQRD